jgi:hypothetical protein
VTTPLDLVRRDPVHAMAYLRAHWDDLSLGPSARLFAESIRYAHSQAPAAWEVTALDRCIRLNVGQIAVAELWPDGPVLYAVRNSYRGSEGITCTDHEYAAVPVRTRRWLIPPAMVERIPNTLFEAHRELMSVAARAKRVSPFAQFHSPGMVKALALTAGGHLPLPEYQKPQRQPGDETPGASAETRLFGDAQENARTEQAAIRVVTAMLTAEGWDISSVERDRCGYDLVCRRGRQERHVEVKGTRGPAEAFIMTAGELRCATTNPQFELFVVGRALEISPTVERWTGRSFEEAFQLEPLQYVARRAQR